MSQDECTKDFLRDSETVSSLLEQNDDLMARIAASAKRTSELERKLKESELSKSELIRKSEILSEQILVFREKDKLQKNRYSSLEGRIKELMSERDFHEIRYSELYQRNLDLQKKRDATNRILVDKIARLERYRSWMRDNAYTEVRRLREEKHTYDRKLKNYEIEIQATEQTLQEEHDRLLSIQADLKKQIVELEHDNNQLNQVKNGFIQLEEKYLSLKDERTAGQNRIIAVEREKEEAIAKMHGDQNELRERLSHFRTESKSLKMENSSLKEELASLLQEHKETLRKMDKLQDQNESLQELWNDNRQRLDKTSQKEVALQKLNQELSSQLKDMRKKVESLQNALQSTDHNSVMPTPHKNEPTKDAKFEKLEALLAEIQSGYSKDKDLEGHLARHDFIENEKLISESGELEA